MKNYYEILGVYRTSDKDTIKRAFRKLASAYHPDKFPENTKFAEDMMKQINAAYSVLSDEGKRSQYDAWLDLEGEPRKKADGENQKSESREYNSTSSNSGNKSNEQSDFSEKNRSERPRAKKKNVFDVEIDLLKRYWVLIAIVLVLAIIKIFPEQKSTGDKPTQSLQTFYNLTLIKMPETNSAFALKVDEGGFSLNLYKDQKLGYYRMLVNGKLNKSVSFAYVGDVYRIERNKITTGYILQTDCGGNSCGSAYTMIDIENKSISEVPVFNGVFFTKGSIIGVDGSQGVDKLGDPIRVSLSYYSFEDFNGNRTGFWIDQSTPVAYRNLIGKHPDDFFSDNNLRLPMLGLYGEDRFKIVRDRTQVAGPIEIVNGDLLVLKGCKPHSCGSDSAITVINVKTSSIHTLYLMNQVLHSIGNPIVDQVINVDGFPVSAYKLIFNDFLESQGFKLNVEIMPNGQVDLVSQN
jgi:DnaJ domain